MNENDNTGNHIDNPKRAFYACSIGLAIHTGTAYGLVGLQSSINVANGLGPNSVFIHFFLALFGIFSSPFGLRIFGQKYTLVLGEIFLLFYTLANFYPRWYTLYPAAVGTGLITSSWTWSAAPAIVQRIALFLADKNFVSGKEVAIQKYMGMFLGIIALGQIFVNTLTKIILTYVNANLFHIEDAEKFNRENSTGIFTTNLKAATALNESEDITSCGSNDCPAEYAYSISRKLDVFIPDQTALHVLLGVYLVLQILAVLIHIFLIPDLPQDLNFTEEQQDDVHEHLLQKTLTTNYFLLYVDSLKKSFKFMFSLQGLLTMPVMVLFGLTVSFAWSELNRAYISCTIGVEQVGICTAMVDLMSFIISLVISQCASRLGLLVIMVFAMIYDLANFVILLLWVPSSNTNFMPYILSLMYGISHGTRRNTAFLIAANHCHDKHIRYSVQTSTVAAGCLITYSWTTVLCVYVKIYIMIGMVIFTSVLWMFSHILLRKRQADADSDF